MSLIEELSLTLLFLRVDCTLLFFHGVDCALLVTILDYMGKLNSGLLCRSNSSKLFIFISTCGDNSNSLFIFSDILSNKFSILSLLYLNILYLFFLYSFIPFKYYIFYSFFIISLFFLFQYLKISTVIFFQRSYSFSKNRTISYL